MAMGRHGHGFNASKIAPAAASELRGVGVEQLQPEAFFGNTDPVVGPRNRAEIKSDNNRLAAGCAVALESEYVVLGVLGIDPFERRRAVFKSVEGRLGAVEEI